MTSSVRRPLRLGQPQFGRLRHFLSSTLGLFPDVGASWFLNRLPGRLGLFMGLTGARLNVADALRVGLADMVIEADQSSALLERLQEERWSGETAADDNRLFRLLKKLFF